MSWIFLGTPLFDGAIEKVICLGDRTPISEISCMICITVCVKEVVILLCLVYF